MSRSTLAQARIAANLNPSPTSNLNFRTVSPPSLLPAGDQGHAKIPFRQKRRQTATEGKRGRNR